MSQDLVDEIWLGNCRDNTQPTTALGTQLDLYLEDPLEWYVTPRKVERASVRLVE